MNLELKRMMGAWDLAVKYVRIVTPHKPSHSKLKPSITSMQPPVRNNQSTNHPGLVNLLRPQKTSTEVAAKKQMKKDVAATKAKAREAKVVQVTRVERETGSHSRKEHRGWDWLGGGAGSRRPLSVRK